MGHEKYHARVCDIALKAVHKFSLPYFPNTSFRQKKENPARFPIDTTPFLHYNKNGSVRE